MLHRVLIIHSLIIMATNVIAVAYGSGVFDVYRTDRSDDLPMNHASVSHREIDDVTHGCTYDGCYIAEDYEEPEKTEAEGMKFVTNMIHENLKDDGLRLDTLVFVNVAEEFEE